jgi:cell division protein FtsB
MQNIRKGIYHIRKSWNRRLQRLGKFANDIGLSVTNFLIIIVLSLLILAIGLNIYFAIRDATNNYSLLKVEQERLEKVQTKNKELEEKLAYYSSLEYKERYARDSLNLVKPGEQIYVVETERREEYDLVEENPDPILKENNRLWWDVILELLF